MPPNLDLRKRWPSVGTVRIEAYERRCAMVEPTGGVCGMEFDSLEELLNHAKAHAWSICPDVLFLGPDEDSSAATPLSRSEDSGADESEPPRRFSRLVKRGDHEEDQQQQEEQKENEDQEKRGEREEDDKWEKSSCVWLELDEEPRPEYEPRSEEPPPKPKSTRQLLEAMVNDELRRVDEATDIAINTLCQSEEYQKASAERRQQLETEIDEESDIVLNNLIWLKKMEQGYENVKLHLHPVGEPDGEKTPTGTKFLPTINLKGFLPQLLDEIYDRYVAIIGSPTAPTMVDRPIEKLVDDIDGVVGNVDPRDDLATKTFHYSLTELRKLMGFAVRPGVARSELNGKWKELRRVVRDEIDECALRDIRRSKEPGRFHKEALSIARKVMARQEYWENARVGIRKQEELAYWLVCREHAIAGDVAAGFGDRDQSRSQNKSSANQSPPEGNKSAKKHTYEANSDEDISQTPHKKLRRRNSVRLSTRRSASTTTEVDLDSDSFSHHQSLAFSHPSKSPLNPNTKSPSPAKKPQSKGIELEDSSPIRRPSTPLGKRREVFELKKLELDAEAIQLALLEKAEAFQNKYGVSYKFV